MTQYALDNHLWLISKEAKRPSTTRRYVAKPFNGDARHWGVWDRKDGRYLKDQEVEALTLQQIREKA